MPASTALPSVGELRSAMVDRRVVDRAQHAVRHVGRARDLQEVPAGRVAVELEHRSGRPNGRLVYQRRHATASTAGSQGRRRRRATRYTARAARTAGASCRTTCTWYTKRPSLRVPIDEPVARAAGRPVRAPSDAAGERRRAPARADHRRPARRRARGSTSARCASELGISRTPLREAFRVLAADGLVALHPNRGAHVVQLSVADVRESFEVMAALEALAGELACRHATAGRGRRDPRAHVRDARLPCARATCRRTTGSTAQIHDRHQRRGAQRAARRRRIAR